MIDDLETRRQVFQLSEEGLSTRAIARVVGTSHTTVARVLREPPPPPAELPAHMAPSAPLVIPLDASSSDAPALVVVRELLAEARAQFAAASACGDSASAQRYARTAAGLTPVLARLEREDREVDGAVRISPGDAAKTRDAMFERIKSICNRPLLCAKCSRELSVFWGTGLSTEAELNADDGVQR
jgi:hypothetical protein